MITKNALLSNCECCGELFLSSGQSFCNKCQHNEYSVMEVLSSYLEKNPNVTISQLTKDTKISEKEVIRLMSGGKLWAFKNLKVKCKICGKPIPASTGKLVCYSCCCELAKGSNAIEKMEKLKSNIRTKLRNVREYHKDQIDKNADKRRYGFKAVFKEQLARYIDAKEVEILPDIMPATNIRLSGNYGLTPAYVYS